MMKKMMRRMLALMLAVMLLLSVTVGALAADYTASNYDELSYAFAGTQNAAGDTTVNVTVTSDITFEDTLTTQENWSYTMSSNNENTLTNASFSGVGTVEINNIDLTGDNGLEASGGVEVTVNNGNITGEDDGIYADSSTVTVTGGDVTGGDDGIEADNSKVTVTGDVTGGNNGVKAYSESTVSVDGNVAGMDGDPDAVDYADPEDYSDGGYGAEVLDSTLKVTGNVTGGNSYGTYGRGGDALYVSGISKVEVGGNVVGGSVTADPDTQGEQSVGGYGIQMFAGGTVSVTGNVTGGSTNGDSGYGGDGLYVVGGDSEAGSVTVGGMVAHGTAPNGVDGYGIYANKDPDTELKKAALPKITVGDYTTMDGADFTDEELAAYRASITVTGIGTKAPAVHVEQETFWGSVLKQLRAAEKGGTVTVDACRRTTMPATIAEAVQELGVTLVIQWDGGDDITIDASFDKVAVNGVYLLADL